VARLSQVGFSANPQPGDTILPDDCGPISKFNAHGRHVPQKDQAKVRTYVTTIMWTWEQWAGRGQTETKSGLRDVYRMCYPTVFDPPPAAEITIVDENGSLLIVTEEIVYSNASEQRILHLANLMLELFGECEVRHANLQRILPPAIRRVNWQMLPPGQQPFPVVQQHVQSVIGNLSARYSAPILGRMQVLVAHNPDEIYFGQGGYRTYVAYIFRAKGLAVLESIMTDNATYVFGQNWQQVSQLTKAQVLTGGLHQARIVHNRNWQNQIQALLR
jgi:hypothetical protein